MTTVQSTRPFTFPERADDVFSYSSSSSGQVSNLEINIPRSSTTSSAQQPSVPLEPLNQQQHLSNNNTTLHRPSSTHTATNASTSAGQARNSTSTPTASAPSTAFVVQPAQTIHCLVESDIAYRAAEANATSAAEEVIQDVVYYNMIHRLHGSLQEFYITLSDSSKLEPARFPPIYQQSIDMCSSLMNNDYPRKAQSFASSMKTGYKSLLNSFLTLIKSSPSFIATALLAMTQGDLNSFSSHSTEPYDDLVALCRTSPLDIMFYSLFPAYTPPLQRAEYFSSICATLIDNRRGEKFCIEILDKFMINSGYPYAASLEILIMGLLQDGAFLTLVSSAVKDASGPASSPGSEEPSPVLSHATLATEMSSNSSTSSLPTSLDGHSSENSSREFVSRAVQTVLEFFDNTAMESIPEGFLMFVRLLLSKVSIDRQFHATSLVLIKYFVHRHLHRVLTSPESLGILKSCFVNDIQRHRILTPVYHNLARAVTTALSSDHAGSDYEDLRVKAHVNSLVRLISAPPPAAVKSTFDLDEKFLAKSTETTEFYSRDQMIVLSPSDIVSLYTSLFPSFGFKQTAFNAPPPPPPLPGTPITAAPSLAPLITTGGSAPRPMSRRASLSGLRSPYPDVYSTTATSYVSSHHSDNLPGLSEIDTQQARFSIASEDIEPVDSPVFTTMGPAEDCEWSLDDIRADMEPVIEELLKKYPYLQFRNGRQTGALYPSLRPNKVQSFRLPHPMTEKWQVFRVDESGEIQMITAESILEQAKIHKGTMLLDTLDDREEPAMVAPANRLLVGIVKRAVERIVTDATSSPYPGLYYGIDSFGSGDPSYLKNLLSDSLDKSLAKGFYLDGNEFSNALTALSKLLPSTSSSNYIQIATSISNHVIDLIAKEKEMNMSKVKHQILTCQAYSGPYQIHLCNSKAQCKNVVDRLHDLRTKVWYITEIRPSSLWNRARDVARALRQSQPAAEPEKERQLFPGLKRNHSASSLSSSGMFSFKRFTTGGTSGKREYASRRQTMINTLAPQLEGMFAPKEFAGENKLSDREAAATKKWLQGQQIQIFCAGEERIHRFCCEVDDLVKRVMGDALSSKRNRGHSLLSSSSLFRHDLWKSIIEVEGGAERSSNASSLVRTATYHGVEDQHTDLNTEKQQPSLRTHRSQKSSPSLLDIFANMDLSGSSKRGSIHTDTSPHDSGFESTSPRHQRASSTDVPAGHRRNRSLNDQYQFKPEDARESSSTNQNSVMETPENDAKRRELDSFILDLQMRLTGMIYSDIGTSCWFEGSETDKWLDAPIVKAALDRDTEQRERVRQQVSRNAAMQATMFKLGEPPEASSTASSRRASRRYSHNSSRPTMIPAEVDSRRQSQQQRYPLSMNAFQDSSETLNKLDTHSRESLSAATVNANIAAAATAASVHPNNIANSFTQTTIVFEYDEAYKNILRRLSVNPSPIGKLNTLYALVMLVVSSLSSSLAGTPSSLRTFSRSNMPSFTSEANTPTPALVSPGINLRAAAAAAAAAHRTGAGLGSLGEAIANAETKQRTATTAGMSTSNPYFGFSGTMTSMATPNTDAIAEELRRIFKANGLRSKTLFRDLQFIAAFVPPSVLDLTDIGKAFWDVCLAALSMKEETLGIIVDVSSEIFQHCTGMISESSDDLFLSSWALSDVAWLWSIAAKEGETVGQRELAIMHMSHPHVTPISLTPFTKLSETFDSTLLQEDSLRGDLDKLDPVRMAVIKHWMQAAAKRGDNIATEYLIQQQEPI